MGQSYGSPVEVRRATLLYKGFHQQSQPKKATPMKPLIASLLFASASLLAQTPSLPGALPNFTILAQAQTAPSVSAPWNTSQSIAAFAQHAARLKPVLDQLSPQEWVAKGAPEIYLSQWTSARQELDYLSEAADMFESQPERLTAALDTYFRFEALEWRLESLIEAVRRYENPAIGDLILSELRSNTSNRDGLREYITELATQKEQEFSVVNQEAQRCRTDLTRK